MNGMTSDELDKYKPINFGWFSCCKDRFTSIGCEWIYDDDVYGNGNYCAAKKSQTKTYQCELAGFTNQFCCRRAPNNRVGSKNWFWERCT